MNLKMIFHTEWRTTTQILQRCRLNFDGLSFEPWTFSCLNSLEQNVSLAVPVSQHFTICNAKIFKKQDAFISAFPVLIEQFHLC